MPTPMNGEPEEVEPSPSQMLTVNRPHDAAEASAACRRGQTGQTIVIEALANAPVDEDIPIFVDDLEPASTATTGRKLALPPRELLATEPQRVAFAEQVVQRSGPSGWTLLLGGVLIAVASSATTIAVLGL